MDTQTTTIIAIIIAVVIILAKVIELLLNVVADKMFPQDNQLHENDKAVASKILKLTQDLHDMHNKYDQDGTPLWYVPRSWCDTQREILKTIESVSHTQEKLSEAMNRCVEVLDRIDRRHTIDQK